MVRLLGQHLDDVHDGEEPGFGLLVIDAADLVAFKNCEVFVHWQESLEPDEKDGMSIDVHGNAIKFPFMVNRKVR